ncbi:uncharacterized protein LOC126253210 [Schistocerca nitens]|uniref:uncharacterized protein LOC126253210 n=1 Tax=Schistocerca nitens TaxID=7011 RepID=UPI0021173BA8|nr:uncharacterized protein LOC126253210 [Schistocerca nitens]
MNHAYSVVPQPLMPPSHGAADRSDFSCSSAPTSPHAPRTKQSAFRRHIRHKSSPPINRAKLPLLNDCDFYPYGKQSDHWAVRARNSANSRIVAVKDNYYSAPSSGNVIHVEDRNIITVDTTHNDDQFFVKVNASRFAKCNTRSTSDKRHRQIYPKDDDYTQQEERTSKCHIFQKETVVPQKCEREEAEPPFIKEQHTRADLHDEMVTEPGSTMTEYGDKPQIIHHTKTEKHIMVRSSVEDLAKDEEGDAQLEVEAYSTDNASLKSGHYTSTRSVEVQVSPSPQYRLRFLPICGCTADESEWEFCQCCFIIRLVGRWAFSQCGLGILLVIWALLGAAAFHSTEGPHEEQQALDLIAARSCYERQLSTELQHLVGAKHTVKAMAGTDQPLDPAWQETISASFKSYENRMLAAVKEGYGEGGGGGRIWSYAGCLLFAVSLLTTLGFGAPVPRTTLGRIAAVIFSAIGIPLHLLLVLNIGMLVAVKLQHLSMTWQRGTSFIAAMIVCCFTYNVHQEGRCTPSHRDGMDCTIHRETHFTAPRWMKLFPAAAIATYYIFGVIVFGAARSRPFSDCLLFPLDFTASGGVGLTSSTVRTCYAIYLEGAVVLAASAVAVWQVSATKGLTNLGLKLGLLTNS